MPAGSLAESRQVQFPGVVFAAVAYHVREGTAASSPKECVMSDPAENASRRRRHKIQRQLDEALEASFPASDPPSSW